MAFAPIETSQRKKPWKTILRQFWQGFFEQIAKVDETVKRSDVTQELLDEACPECSKPLSSRLGRMGRFIGCTGYPECRYTRNIVADGEDAAPPPEEEKVDRPCPKCKADLIYKQGRYGRFIGCSGYPACRHIESLNKPKALEIDCPVCKKNKLLERKSRYGKLFYGCAGYPDCKYALWYKPIEQACPQCKWPILMQKETKRRGKELVCAKEGCDFSQSLDQPEA